MFCKLGTFSIDPVAVYSLAEKGQLYKEGMSLSATCVTRDSLCRGSPGGGEGISHEPKPSVSPQTLATVPQTPVKQGTKRKAGLQNEHPIKRMRADKVCQTPLCLVDDKSLF